MLLNACLLACCMLTIHALWLLMYRLLFHPLSGFPGPKIAAASKWYEFYFDIVKRPGGTFIYEIERMHDIYGPIVRINPDEVHVRDSEWFEKLYTTSSMGTRNKYAPAAHMTGTPLGIFGTVDHEIHRRRRAAINPFFSKRAVAKQHDMILNNIETFMEGVARDLETTGCADLRINYLALTTDILCDHCFEYKMDLLKDSTRARDWKNTIKAIAILTPLIKQFTWIIPTAKKLPVQLFNALGLPSLARILILIRQMRSEARSAINKFDHLTDQKASESVPSLDLFDTILTSSLPSAEKETERMAQEGFVIIAAGGETTSRVLTNATYYLLAGSKETRARLKTELDSVFGFEDSQPSLQSIQDLEWLTAIIKESLRLTALVTSRLPLVAPSETLTYKGWSIPPSTPVSMTLRDVLLDPAIFNEPLEFRPERWLRENPDLEHISRYYLPFGRGSRMCIGLNLALAELHMTLAYLFHRLDLELHDTTYDRDVKIVRDCFIGEVSLETKGMRVALR